MALTAVGLVAGCGADDGTSPSSSPRIVTTTSDPHDFALSARQAAELADADLIVTSGLGFEAGLSDAITEAEGAGVPVLRLGEDLDPLPLDGDEDHEDAEHEHGDLDPHWFTDPVRMADAAVLIGDAVAGQTETAVADAVQARATGVADELRALDREVRTILDPIQPANRRIVTDHEVFGYFAERYDLAVAGVLVPGGTTLAETTPDALTELVDTVEELEHPAIFVTSSASIDLAEAVAGEIGGSVEVVRLFAESLGPTDSAGDTYPSMIRADADRIAAALT
jgi:zinc/manganese transport system substrate-binding protein